MDDRRIIHDGQMEPGPIDKRWDDLLVPTARESRQLKLVWTPTEKVVLCNVGNQGAGLPNAGAWPFNSEGR
jgi:hypothetical protein